MRATSRRVRSHASCLLADPTGYRPRSPAQSTLYQVVSSELEPFLARQSAADRPVPEFVESEFRAFLECGILAHGFCRVHCAHCRKDVERTNKRAASPDLTT